MYKALPELAGGCLSVHWFTILFIFLRQSLTLLPRLECNGMISALGTLSLLS